jgi:hypothetical protein
VTLGFCPNHRTSVPLGPCLGLTQRGVALLSINGFSALIAVKFLRFHGFNTGSSFLPQLLKTSIYHVYQ